MVQQVEIESYRRENANLSHIIASQAGKHRAKPALPDHPREFVLEALMGMLPGEFEQVVFLYDIPKTHMPTGVSQTEQSITLIKYAEQREGGNLEHLRQIIDKVQGWTKQNNAPRGNHHG